jgi:type IV pilus assembly protein PilC
MLAAGQETGALESVLGTVAEAYSADLEAASRKVAALIEPLAILAVALVVAFVVAAVLLPVFELSTLQ